MVGSWLLALVVPPESELGGAGSVRYKHSLASDTTNSDPAGHAEVTTGDDVDHHHHHHCGLDDDDFEEDDDPDEDKDD